MSDPETFLVEVYVAIDDLLRPLLAGEARRPGPPPALSPSEVITLAVVSQWARFRSGRDFYRYADTRLRSFFPRLPSRPQYLRQALRRAALIARIALLVADWLVCAPHEVIDTMALPVRNAKRRGASWLAEQIALGKSTRLGWYTGFRLLTCVSPSGVLTGYGLAPANRNDRLLAEDLFQARAAVTSSDTAGHPQTGDYLADMGFGGADCEARWRTASHANVICPPQPDRQTRVWTAEHRRWLSTQRQIIESAHARLITAFRLGAEHAHSNAGVATHLAATAVLHNLTIWFNRRHGRPDLAVVDVLGW
jgi:hypothetical protein